jgi:hypothetical protein
LSVMTGSSLKKIWNMVYRTLDAPLSCPLL